MKNAAYAVSMRVVLAVILPGAHWTNLNAFPALKRLEATLRATKGFIQRGGARADAHGSLWLA